MGKLVRNTFKTGLLTLSAFVFSGTLNAASVSLISGAADPYNMGSVPVPSNLPQPFSDAQMSSMSTLR